MSPDADTEPDYSAVEIPREKEPAEYNATERRAELLDLVHARGSPHALNQTRLGQRYGVSQQMISKDLDRLAEHVADSLGGRRSLQGRALYEKCIEGLLDDEDWRGAASVYSQYSNWLDARTGGERAGEDPSAVEPRTESDSYRIVDDADDSVRVAVPGEDTDGGGDATDDAPAATSDARGATDHSRGAAGDTDADPAPDGGRPAGDATERTDMSTTDVDPDPAADAGESPDSPARDGSAVTNAGEDTADGDVDDDGVVRDADGRVIGRRVERDANPGTADATRTNGENDDSEEYDPGPSAEASDLEPRDWRNWRDTRASPSRHALFRDGYT